MDEDYRGRGLAMALYGIVLVVQKKVLVAGDSQTPGGRKNWLNLASIPGCEVKGFLTVSDKALRTRAVPKSGKGGSQFKQWDAESDNRMAETYMDHIMKLGGEYIGPYKDYGSAFHAFAFPVTGVGSQLANAIKIPNVTLYNNGYGQAFDTGLYAQWTGAT